MCRNPTCSLSNKGMEGKCYSIIDNIGNACISICFIKGENLHYKQKEFPNKACQLKFWLWFEFVLVSTDLPLFTLSLQNKNFSDLHYGNLPMTDSTFYFSMIIFCFSDIHLSHHLIFNMNEEGIVEQRDINLHLFPWSSWGYCPLRQRLVYECSVSFPISPHSNSFNATIYIHLQ